MAWPLVIFLIGLGIALKEDEIVKFVRKGLDSWRPGRLGKEIGYRVNLAAHLRLLGNDNWVVEEDGAGRGRRDICIKDKKTDDTVIVELKVGLKRQSESDRLLGQILKYREGSKALFVILVDPEPNTLAEFEQVVKRELADKGKIEIRVLESDDASADQPRAAESEQEERVYVAYHEAGHIVVGAHLGLPLGGATIVPEGRISGSCGDECNPRYYEFRTRRSQKAWTRKAIISLYAGDEAELLLDPDHTPGGGGSDRSAAYDLSVDFEIFPDGIEFIGDDLHDEYLENLQAEAREILERRWSLVAKIAGALLERGTLSKDEAIALLPRRRQTKSKK